MSALSLFLVCLGGALGALCRYWTSRGSALFWPEMKFPGPTLFVNLTGSALLGAVIGFADFDLTTAAEAPFLVFAGVGFCGAYTTFSSFCTETVALMRTSRRLATIYITTTVVGSIAAFSAIFTLATL
jgi:fluoride exporter